MLSFDILFNFFISFIIGILFYKISIPFLKKNIISNPNARSSHLIPKANGGGIIFVTLFIIVSFCLKVYWPLSLLPLAIIGFFDDIKSQSQKLRFAVQATTSIYLNLLFLNKILILENSLFYLFLINLFLIFLSIAIINFVNFMDGIDGLVTSNILCLLIMKFYFGDSSIIYLIGFLSSFLYFNWYPSKIFMGDVGSTFLGGALVYILISSESVELFFAYLIASGPIIIDPAICILRRFKNSENIFRAHKKHLYQRLVNGGLEHWKVSSLYLFSTSIICLGYIWGNIKLELFIMILLCIIAYILEKKYATPFENI